jgi:hypothetical protein
MFGGHDLDAFLRARLAPQLEKSHQQGDTTVNGEIAKRTPHTSSHWRSYATEAKEIDLCRAVDGVFDAAQNSPLPLINYVLPKKTIVTLGTESFSVAEQLFTLPDAESPECATVTDASRPRTFWSVSDLRFFKVDPAAAGQSDATVRRCAVNSLCHLLDEGCAVSMHLTTPPRGSAVWYFSSR